MKQTGDLNLVKKINTSIVLEHIRSHSPISRAQIAEVTGLTKATVSSLVNELISSDLVHEIGAGASSGGRKPMMLLFNSTAGYAIGVDLGVDYIYAALSDLNGTLVEQFRITHDNISRDQVISDLKACIHKVISLAPKSPYGIVGIGIGIPGISDEQGNVLFAPNLRWENVPLQSIIGTEFNIPVVIDNEANAGAVGEKQFGAGKSAANLVYISIGSGIGTGIIIKNELYRGSSGFSGEMGHMSIEHDGLKCVCGNKGCWELFASEKALLDKARLSFGDSEITMEKLLSMADQGDQRAVELFEHEGKYLSVGVINIINSFNPEMIVIGGRMADAEKWLRTPLLDRMNERSLSYPRAQLDVRFSELGSQSTVLGACSFAIHAFFASNKSWVELQAYFPT
jgi:glucokinase-like ROK family protein